MTDHPLRIALEHGMKNVMTATYDWMYKGVARHGAMEWTVLSEEDPPGLIRIVSAFEIPQAEDPGTTLFELRGYACDREDHYSEEIRFSGSMPTEGLLDKFVDQLFAAVGEFNAGDLRF